MRAWLGTVVVLMLCSAAVFAQQPPHPSAPPLLSRRRASLTRRCRCPNRAKRRWRAIAAGLHCGSSIPRGDSILPAAILLTGFSARMRNWACGSSRRRVLTIAIYFAIFSIVTFVIDLPRAYYEEFVREHAYGLSNQTLRKWFGDSAQEPGGRHDHRRAVPVGAVSAAAEESAAVVALHGDGGRAVPRV